MARYSLLPIAGQVVALAVALMITPPWGRRAWPRSSTSSSDVAAPTRTRPPRRPLRPASRPPRRPPTTNENAAGENLGPRRRLQPAGHVVVVGVLALLLGALLNASGLRKTAESQNPGWKRDVSLP